MCFGSRMSVPELAQKYMTIFIITVHFYTVLLFKFSLRPWWNVYNYVNLSLKSYYVPVPTLYTTRFNGQLAYYIVSHTKGTWHTIVHHSARSLDSIVCGQVSIDQLDYLFSPSYIFIERFVAPEHACWAKGSIGSNVVTLYNNVLGCNNFTNTRQPKVNKSSKLHKRETVSKYVQCGSIKYYHNYPTTLYPTPVVKPNNTTDVRQCLCTHCGSWSPSCRRGRSGKRRRQRWYRG